MKTMLIVWCLGFASLAFGQSAGTPAVSSTVYFAEHAQRAAPQHLAREQNLVESFDSVYIEHGEMPLADVPLPPVHEVPLGDIARALKKEHATVKKAVVVLEN